MRVTAALLSVLITACGPSAGQPGSGDGSGNGTDGGASGPQVAITGTVWAPGNAPGMVPAGHEIPVANATVYVTGSEPAAIPQRVQCTPCIQAPTGAVDTDAKGHFTLHAAPGSYWLVIQKAQFRLDQEITIGSDMTLDAQQTTLPSTYDPDNGRWIPHIAVASAFWDKMEGILGKMGIGQVDPSGHFVSSSAAGNFDVYSNGGNLDSVAVGSLTDLVSNLDKMMNYHIIFIPCSDNGNVAALNNTKVLQNIRDYVAAGGRLYVTDWSGEWEDNVFPAEIEFGSGYDTPAAAYNRSNNSWNTGMFGDADGFPEYNSNDGQAVDADLHAWLDGQMGPDVNGREITIDASRMEIDANYDHIMNLASVDLGTDMNGNHVTDTPLVYVKGSDANGLKPLTVTFEPAGCGRVLYSTYHTTDSDHVGLIPQERVLLYLMLEIGVCKEGPVVD